MSWVLDKPGLLAVVRSILDPEVDTLGWANDGQLMPSRAKVTLEVFSMSSLGVDEHRRFLSDGTDGYPAGTWWVLEIGNRDIHLTIRAEAYDISVEAAEVIDTIRTRIRAEQTTEALDALGIAYVTSSSTVNLPATYDNRIVSAATFDLKIAAVAKWVSLIESDGGGYISTVNTNNVVTGTLEAFE